MARSRVKVEFVVVFRVRSLSVSSEQRVWVILRESRAGRKRPDAMERTISIEDS